MMRSEIRIFGLASSCGYAKQVCEHLDRPLSRHDEELFEDGEVYVKSNENARGTDAFVIQSLYSNKTETISEKFIKLCFFIGSLKDASAERVTAVIPYLGYARQDRKDQSRAPITTKYVAQMLEAAGADRVLTLDVHNVAAEQNAFRIPIDILEARQLLANSCRDELKKEEMADRAIAILSPDAGGYERAEKFRNSLAAKLEVDVGMIQLDKIRVNRKVQAGRIIGDVKGKLVIILDDMIASGGTVQKAAEVVQKEGGEVWGVAATHGLFVGNANENLRAIPKIYVTDTVDPFRLEEENRQKLRIVNTSKIFSQAIGRIHEGIGSISDLLKDNCK